MAVDITELFMLNPRERALRAEGRRQELLAARAAAMAAQTGAVNPAAAARLQALARSDTRAATASRMARAKVEDEAAKIRGMIQLAGLGLQLGSTIGGMASGGGGGGGTGGVLGKVGEAAEAGLTRDKLSQVSQAPRLAGPVARPAGAGAGAVAGTAAAGTQAALMAQQPGATAAQPTVTQQPAAGSRPVTAEERQQVGAMLLPSSLQRRPAPRAAEEPEPEELFGPGRIGRRSVTRRWR